MQKSANKKNDSPSFSWRQKSASRDRKSKSPSALSTQQRSNKKATPGVSPAAIKEIGAILAKREENISESSNLESDSRESHSGVNSVESRTLMSDIEAEVAHDAQNINADVQHNGMI